MTQTKLNPNKLAPAGVQPEEWEQYAYIAPGTPSASQSRKPQQPKPSQVTSLKSLEFLRQKRANLPLGLNTRKRAKVETHSGIQDRSAGISNLSSLGARVHQDDWLPLADLAGAYARDEEPASVCPPPPTWLRRASPPPVAGGAHFAPPAASVQLPEAPDYSQHTHHDPPAHPDFQHEDDRYDAIASEQQFPANSHSYAANYAHQYQDLTSEPVLKPDQLPARPRASFPDLNSSRQPARPAEAVMDFNFTQMFDCLFD